MWTYCLKTTHPHLEPCGYENQPMFQPTHKAILIRTVENFKCGYQMKATSLILNLNSF